MENIVKTEQLYEGKAKKVFATNDPDLVIVDYKDDATAFNGEKKGTIVGKGAINNKMTNYMFKLLEKEGIPTHLVEEISDRETIVKKVEIVPLEVIVRNVAAGSFSKKLGIEEGTKLKQPTLEFSYKCDELGDPFINKYYALGLGLATEEEIEDLTKYAFKVNEFMLGSTSRSSSADSTERYFLLTRSHLILAVSGILRHMRSSTRTDSEETWAALKRLTMR